MNKFLLLILITVHCVEISGQLLTAKIPEKKNLIDSLTPDVSKKFVKRANQKLIDTLGNEFIMQGISFANNSVENIEIPNKHHSELDFERVAKLKMNAIRFYLNYRTLEDDKNPYVYKDSGWQWIDENIEWAKRNNIYLIIHIHVPPGDNSEGSLLWDDPENEKRLIALWKAIAQRYSQENVIAGFDLMNEPGVKRNIDDWKSLAQLIASEIRIVDKNHLLVVTNFLNAHADPDDLKYNNLFLINDENVLYSFNFYDPIEFTQQGAKWINSDFGAGGKYPDMEHISTTAQKKWYTGTLSNPKALKGNTKWRFYKGDPYLVRDPNIHVGNLVVVGKNISKTVYFDNLTLKEYDINMKLTRIIADINPAQNDGYSFWSSDDTGEGFFCTAKGKNDHCCLTIKETVGDANITLLSSVFIPKQNHYYEASGWIKGNHLTLDSNACIRADFYTLPSGRPLPRNKEFLESVFQPYLNFRKDKNVPIYVSQYGVIQKCYENGKGGLNWLEDVIDIFQENNIHSTMHSYHDSYFGLYTSFDGLPRKKDRNNGLYKLFKRKFNN